MSKRLDQRGTKVKLPKIGDTITNSRARDLCQHFGFDNLVKRIDEAQPGEFRDWVLMVRL